MAGGCSLAEKAGKRLEAALKAFGPGLRIYQYLFKTNRPEIPFARYDDAVVDAAIDQRRTFFDGKRDELFQVEIFYVVLLEGQRAKRGIPIVMDNGYVQLGKKKMSFTRKG